LSELLETGIKSGTEVFVPFEEDAFDEEEVPAISKK
jgi:hypothetical protein